MRRHLPPLNSLLAFEAAARHGNFTHAARELNVAQPAVTRHVSNLEEWLGIELFVRTGNAVQLSADGHAVAELVTSGMDRLELGLGQFSNRRKDEITIGASFGITHLWLMPRITGMRGAAAGATIQFLTSENIADLEASNIDFSIRFGSGNWPGKQADLLFQETTFVIASPEFLKSNPTLKSDLGNKTLRPEWLLEHGDANNQGWMTWQLWHEHQGIAPPVTLKAPNVANYPALLDMVRCGEGIALGYVGLDDHLFQSGDIVRLGKPLHRPHLGYFLVSAKRQELSVAGQKLRQYLTGQ